MKKSNTYKGTPKPFGKTGWFNESPRHSMSAKGLKSTAPKGIIMPLPKQDEFKPVDEIITKAEKEKDAQDLLKRLEDTTDNKEIGDALEDMGESLTIIEFPESEEPEVEIDYEELEIKEEPKKSVWEQATKGAEETKLLKTLRAKKKTSSLEEGEEERLEELEEETLTGAGKFGSIIANLMKGYDREELSSLTKSQLKNLAIKYEATEEGGFWGKPTNPFKEELFARVRAETQINLEQEREQAKMLPEKIRMKKEIAEIRAEAKSGKVSSGLLGDIKEIWS